MAYLKKYFIVLNLFVVTITNIFSQTQQSIQKDNVIAQMNYCINSLTNIIHNEIYVCIRT